MRNTLFVFLLSVISDTGLADNTSNSVNEMVSLLEIALETQMTSEEKALAAWYIQDGLERAAAEDDEYTTLLVCGSGKVAAYEKIEIMGCVSVPGMETYQLVAKGKGLSLGGAISLGAALHHGPKNSIRGRYSGVSIGLAKGWLGGRASVLENIDNGSVFALGAHLTGLLIDISSEHIVIR